MLRRFAKPGVIVVAFAVLAVEGYLLYEYHDRYYGIAAPPEQATLRRAGGADGSVSPGTFEETGYETTRGSGGTADGRPSLTHAATGENSRGDYTYLSDPAIDGDPNAVVFASPTDPYGHNIGVWFEPERQRWAVFNQDLAPVPAGSTFAVVIPREAERFVHRATGENVTAGSTYIDDPLTNGKPDAQVSVTQNWNPGGGNGVYNDHPVGVRYDPERGRWAVFNKDGARMPLGAAFNVAVSADVEPAE